MPSQNLQFPAGFFWGAASSAHQAEGGNTNDWTEWEKQNAERLSREAEKKYKAKVPDWELIKNEAQNPQNYISNQAADHYRKFKGDVQILKVLNLNAYRFSIEWSRVQPTLECFDDNEIAHYRQVIDELKNCGIEPFVTLWHRSNPLWIAKHGGWENKETVRQYLIYAQKMAEEFGKDVQYWMPLNEPIFFILGSYLGGEYPPEIKSLRRADKVFGHLVQAFLGASNIIHEHCPNAQVGTADAGMYLEAHKNKWYNKLTIKLIDWYCNRRFTKAVQSRADFLGVQYYSRGLVGWKWHGWYPKPEQIIEIKKQSDMGWEIYPQGLYNFLMCVKQYNKPVFITENGIADARDKHRAEFIREHIAAINRAISHGANVKGYFYWSLLDNLEWNKGFWPKFGLAEVDRLDDFCRTVRKSAEVYAQIAKNNGLI